LSSTSFFFSSNGNLNGVVAASFSVVAIGGLGTKYGAVAN